MEEIELYPLIFPLLISFFLLWSITKWFNKPARNKNLLPSPPKLPIIGNFHQLGSLPHRNLRLLAEKHGPLMLLHFGSVPVLVFSSADAAREILKNHDVILRNRPQYKVYKKIMYNCKDLAFTKYGEYWRQAKTVLVLHMLSSKRVQSFRSIREEEMALFVERIRESSGMVNLTKIFSELTMDVTCRSVFGRKYSCETEKGKKFVVMMTEFNELIGAIGVGDFIPWLSWINRINGFDNKVDRVAKEMDDFLEDLIQEWMESSKGQSVVEKNDEKFVDILLRIHNDNNADVPLIDRDGIKALLLDAVSGGTVNVFSLLEWLMAQLLRYPTVMEKLQTEVRQIIQHKEEITDVDLEKMHYLKAVIKETLRYQPPAPLLTRILDKDVQIKGHDVRAGTLMMANAWAIGRDPECWNEPEKFEPERFLNSNIDYKGLDFELIPFGAGRRACPGISYAVATVEFVIANLVHKFNWELPDGAQGKVLDMSEYPGATIHRAMPLLAVATRSI